MFMVITNKWFKRCQYRIQTSRIGECVMLARERTLSKNEVSDILSEINQKKIIKTTSIGIVGLGAFKIVYEYSNAVDNFIFSNIKEFLLSSNFSLLGISIPNWFSLALLVMIFVCSSVDIYTKIIKKGS